VPSQLREPNAIVRILHRQIWKEVLSHALLGLVLFTFVLFLRSTTQLLELALRDTALWQHVLYLALLTFPGLLGFTIPMAVLVGVLIGLSRMSSDNEVTAMRAAGISVRAFFLPIGGFAVAGCLLAIYCSAYLAPLTNRLRVEQESLIGLRQISAEVQPRVFEERFPNLVLYVRDAVSGPQPTWRGIFLAELSNPDRPKITLAEEGVLFNEPDQNRPQLHLKQGTIHEAGAQPGDYSIATFSETDIPLPLPPPAPSSVKPNAQRTNAELLAMPRSSPDWLEARIELQRRFALPLAAIFLILAAVPIGLASHKGGKSSGIILTLLMIVAYYSLFVGGITLARQGWLPIWLGVWAPNLLFGTLGALLLWGADNVRPLFGWLAAVEEWPQAALLKFSAALTGGDNATNGTGLRNSATFRWILDRYVARSFLTYLVVIVALLVVLIEIVTFFLDLLNDVIQNQIPASMVFDYFVYLTPQLIYVTTPLAVLVAVLVSFAILTQNNEITAAKASGVSLYRLTLPVLVASGLLSVGLFLFELSWVPAANRHQDAVRNQIKGRPAQTYLRPDRKWIVGEGSRIYYYSFFEPSQNLLGGVTVFEFDPHTYQLTRRISAARARWEPALKGWVFEEGWERTLRRDSVATFEQFSVRVFPEFREPPSYFLKEVRQSTQMNFFELRDYVGDLKRSGFDVVPLSVQMDRKFSFPLFALIMALIGLPFAFSIGKRGALTGIAIAIGIAVAFWATDSLFEALGNLNQLPPVAAAWSPDLLFGLGGLYLFLRVRT
jgi:LPS export ABC transporter permease LptF/LPS export ABC transporter permease LptG